AHGAARRQAISVGLAWRTRIRDDLPLSFHGRPAIRHRVRLVLIEVPDLGLGGRGGGWRWGFGRRGLLFSGPRVGGRTGQTHRKHRSSRDNNRGTQPSSSSHYLIPSPVSVRETRL